MRIVHLVLLILFICAIVVFCIQNLDNVTVKYLSASMTIPMPVLVFLIYILGMFSGGSVLAFIRRSIHGVTKEKKKAEA